MHRGAGGRVRDAHARGDVFTSPDKQTWGLTFEEVGHCLRPLGYIPRILSNIYF